MRSCEAIYGPDQAEVIEELIILATGQACPCRRAEPCPLLDGGGCNPLAEHIPPAAAPDSRDAANQRLAEVIAAAHRP